MFVPLPLSHDKLSCASLSHILQHIEPCPSQVIGKFNLCSFTLSVGIFFEIYGTLYGIMSHLSRLLTLSKHSGFPRIDMDCICISSPHIPVYKRPYLFGQAGRGCDGEQNKTICTNGLFMLEPAWNQMLFSCSSQS